MFKWIWNKYLWAESKALDHSPGWIKKWATKNKAAFRVIIFILWLLPAGLTAYAGFLLAWRLLALIGTGLAWMLAIK